MVQLSGHGRQGQAPSLLDKGLGVEPVQQKAGQGLEKEYRQFVSWGIGKPTIWTEVQRGQSLLGEEDFVDKLSDHLRRRERHSRDSAEPALCGPTVP